MEKEKAIFADYLYKHGLRMTGQRQTILNEFLREEGHQSAEELTAAVKKKDKTIGQATVYRNLRIFAESGIAREVRFGDGVVRYEHNVGHEHHDHLTCENCDKTIEVCDPQIEELQEKLAAAHDFVITGHVMHIYGLCEKCRREK
ncbi:MAG: Peroxide-responsive repressor PerR [Syntrophorhabdaceae bacterium PtaU1.Bin034]|jgi:Fur family ferric uptake transcriptional regulator|nr:MAG: Peroxide-responsive repressor PerR [Syntrophorhabdaceae bacterium PtaU1.Bin034]